MNVSFTGALGTGKTSSMNKLASSLHNKCNLIEDQARYFCKKFAYKNMKAFYTEDHCSFYSSSLNASLAYLLYSFEKLGSNKHGLTLVDHDPIAYYAYYQNRVELFLEDRQTPLINRLISHYSSQIDINFYFPVNTIPLIADDVRVADYAFPLKIDQLIKKGITILNQKI